MRLLFVISLYPGKLRIVWFSSTPAIIREDTPTDLKCSFSGWPLPHKVYWHKNGVLITNGTEGIYHSEEQGKNEILDTKLFFPPGREEQEGFYKCTAMNSFSGWSSKVSSTSIQMKYKCK